MEDREKEGQESQWSRALARPGTEDVCREGEAQILIAFQPCIFVVPFRVTLARTCQAPFFFFFSPPPRHHSFFFFLFFFQLPGTILKTTNLFHVTITIILQSRFYSHLALEESEKCPKSNS